MSFAGMQSTVNCQSVLSVHHQLGTSLSETWCCLDVRVGSCKKAKSSVRLSALVFVEMQFLHLLLQEGNGHGASSASLGQLDDL